MENIIRVLWEWWTVLGIILAFGIIAFLGLVIFNIVAGVISIVIIEGIAGFRKLWKKETSEL